MREIVHVQAGQCGNQIGVKVGLYRQVVHLECNYHGYLCINPVLVTK